MLAGPRLLEITCHTEHKVADRAVATAANALTQFIGIALPLGTARQPISQIIAGACNVPYVVLCHNAVVVDASGPTLRSELASQAIKVKRRQLYQRQGIDRRLWSRRLP